MMSNSNVDSFTTRETEPTIKNQAQEKVSFQPLSLHCGGNFYSLKLIEESEEDLMDIENDEVSVTPDDVVDIDGDCADPHLCVTYVKEIYEYLRRAEVSIHSLSL